MNMEGVAIMYKNYNGIVIFGGMGSGKDTLAAQFSELRENAKLYNIGVLCREMMKVAKINPTWRGMERYIGQTVADKLRQMDKNIMCDYIMALIYERWSSKYGWDEAGVSADGYNADLLEKLAVIRNDELSIIVGGRTLTDLTYWKTKGYLVIGVKISDEVRQQRLLSRDGAETAENSNAEHNTESDVPYIVNNLCDDIIINDGTIEDLKEAANKMLEKYNF
jgi:dephospho-CoA kinase